MKSILTAIFLCLSVLGASAQHLHLSNGTTTSGTPNHYLNFTDTVSVAGWNIMQSNVPPASNTQSGTSFCCYIGTQFSILRLDSAMSSTWTNGSWIAEMESTGCTNNNIAICPKFTHPTFSPYYNSGANKCGLGYSTTPLSIGADMAEIAAVLGEPAHDTGVNCTLAWGCGYLDQSEHVGIADGNVYQNRTAGGNVGHDYGLPDFSTVTGNTAVCKNSSQFGELVATDIVVLLPGRLTDIPVLASLTGAGIEDVYEPGDDRDCPTGTSYFQTEAAILASANTLGTAPSYHYVFILNANYMNANGKGRSDGICPNFSATPNSDTILGLVSAWYLGLPTASTTPQADWNTQLTYFNSPVPSKLGIRYWMTYGLAGVSAFYASATSPTKYYGVRLTPNGVPQGCTADGTSITAGWAGVNSPTGC